MYKPCFHFVLCLGLALLSSSLSAAVLIGAKVPDFEGRDLGGKLHRLSDYAGKFVVLEWSSPECPYSRRYYDEGTLDALHDYAKKSGVIWINVVPRLQTLTAEQVREQWDSAKKIVILDSALEISAAFGAATTPQILIIDGRGILAYSGAVDSTTTFKKAASTVVPYVRNALEDLLAGRKVGKPITRTFGCYIPYDAQSGDDQRPIIGNGSR